MPLGGITAGTQSILGYNYGAGDTRRVMRAEKRIVLLCFIFTAVMFVIAQTMATPFVRIFTTDPVHIEQAAWMIRTYTLGVQMCIRDRCIPGNARRYFFHRK